MALHRFDDMIRELKEELRLIDSAIAVIEGMSEGRPSAPRRGRTHMSDAERHQVSDRLRKYWADRKRRQEQSMRAAGA